MVPVGCYFLNMYFRRAAHFNIGPLVHWSIKPLTVSVTLHIFSPDPISFLELGGSSSLLTWPSIHSTNVLEGTFICKFCRRESCFETPDLFFMYELNMAVTLQEVTLFSCSLLCILPKGCGKNRVSLSLLI